MTLSRREFVQAAAAMGASLAWSGRARASRTPWREAREFYPESVASGDPEPTASSCGPAVRSRAPAASC